MSTPFRSAVQGLAALACGAVDAARVAASRPLSRVRRFRLRSVATRSPRPVLSSSSGAFRCAFNALALEFASCCSKSSGVVASAQCHAMDCAFCEVPSATIEGERATASLQGMQPDWIRGPGCIDSARVRVLSRAAPLPEKARKTQQWWGVGRRPSAVSEFGRYRGSAMIASL